MEIINGQLHSESIARVSAAQVGGIGECGTICSRDEFDGFIDSVDGGLSFGFEGSASHGEVFLSTSYGGSIAWDPATFDAEGWAY